MSFEDFQDGRHGNHLGYRNRIFIAILNLHLAPMPSPKFRLNLTKGSGADVVSRFSRRPPRPPAWIAEQKILAILNLYGALMLPLKFRLNPSYSLGGDVV